MSFRNVELTEEDIKKITTRIKKIKGQVSALEGCTYNKPDLYRILQQLAAANGALRSLMYELMEIEMKNAIHQESTSEETKQKATETIIKMMRSYLK